MLLDRIQKGFEITKEQSDYLRKDNLIEGRYPNIYISSDIAKITNKEKDYIDNKGLDNAYYQKNDLAGTQIVIKGWCVISGKEPNPIVTHVLLRDVNSNIYYKLPTTVVTRDDVTEYINDGTDYKYSGFESSFKYSGFDFESTSYEIVLLYEIGDEAYLIPSGQIISEKEETDDEE